MFVADVRSQERQARSWLTGLLHNRMPLPGVLVTVAGSRGKGWLERARGRTLAVEPSVAGLS
jgi:hypothetical protein